MSETIEVKDLVRTFGIRTALDSLSFSIGTGERVMLLGHNGAGKTTLMRILACFYPPTSGSVSVAGYDILTHSLDVRAAIGYLPEAAPLYDDLTVREYLRFYGRLRFMSGQRLYRRIIEVLDYCGLTQERHTLIRVLSRGQRVRTALAATLLHRPKVLLLDDPFAAVDADSRAMMCTVLKEHCRESAMLISTHVPDILSSVATRAIILSQGRIIS